jgi:Outer membrane protein and related peptidoglycan-associated (lipo)proteins
MKKANQQFEAGNYDKAYTIFQKASYKLPYDRTDLKAEAMLKMAVCAQVLQRLQPSENAFNNAVKLKSKDENLRLELARLYHRQGKYATAIKQYQLFLDKNPDNRLAKLGILGCQIADTLTKNPTRYTVKAEAILNTRQGEFAPMLFGRDYNQIYFTTNREQAIGKKRSDVTGMKKTDIFVSKLNNADKWDKPKPLEGGINTPADEGIVSFNGDQSMMIFTRCRNMEESSSPAEIYISKRNDQVWSEPQRLLLFRDSTEMAAHAAYSPKGDYIYFVSEKEGGQGGKDIWRAKIDGNKVSEVSNLGPQINTPGNEMFPYVRENGDLYFASDGLPGMGGLDLFHAVPLPDGSWKVENMGAPVNTNGDDFGITFAGLEEHGFFSSNRGDNKGYDHIFNFELPSVKIFIEGTVKSGENQNLPDAVLHIVSDRGMNTKTTVKKDGSFKFVGERGVKYQLLASGKGYLNAYKNIEVVDAEKDATYKADFALIPLAKPIQVNNIFYDVDKTTLRPESKEALDQIIRILKDNPHITIELSSHTDMNGTVEYNQQLSDGRANEVVNYLIRGGIEKDRLTPKGYGKGSPKTVDASMAEKYSFLQEGEELNEEYIKRLTPQQQEIANQINRRTEFRVLKTTYNLF